MTDPACRLLTLVGVGGIGKTRLSIQAGDELADHFEDGVFFVPLQSLESLDLLPIAIADTLRVQLAGQEDLLAQLCGYLRDQQILLILDNFEHLRGDNDLTVLADLLDAAPGLKMLITSRESLQLIQEWLFVVEGLPVPSSEADLADGIASVELFVERARQMRRDFSAENEPDALATICRLVDGMPLALELAAAWTKTLTCADIVREIESGLDILSSSLRNIPQRHRSIQAIFDHTWGELSEREQNVFARLSVFRGGFDRTAAMEVANATLPMLASFMDRALLRWEPVEPALVTGGRYQIHELLRQYGADILATNLTDSIEAQEMHSAYYATYLYEHNPFLRNTDQLQRTREVGLELQNIRVAWDWAVVHHKLGDIQKASKGLAIFYQFESRYKEGLDVFQHALDYLMQQADIDLPNANLTDMMMGLAWFNLRHGQLEEAERTLDRLQGAYDQLGINPVTGPVNQPDVMRGFVSLARGDIDSAARHAQNALAEKDRYIHLANQEFANSIIAQVDLARGHLDEADAHAQTAYDLGEQIENTWYRAYILNTLGDIATARQDHATAQNYYAASFEIRSAFNDAEGMAVALNHLGEVALRQRNYVEAEKNFRESLQLYTPLSDKGGLATSYQGLGETALAQGDFLAARDAYASGLQLSTSIDYTARTLTILLGIGELFCRTGYVARGIALLTLVKLHAGSNQESRRRIVDFLEGIKRQVARDEMEAAVKAGHDADLTSVLKSLLVELPLLTMAAEESSDASQDRPATDANQALIEPLTERELEVLSCMAAGLSNQEIANELVIATGTVKFYSNQIYGKLQVRNRTEAVVMAQQLSLI